MASPEPTAQQQLAAEYEIVDPGVTSEDVAPTDARLRDDKGRFVPAELEPKVDPKHSHFTTRLALEAGLSQSEIDGYTPDALEAVVAREYKQLRTERERRFARAAEEPSGVPIEFADNPPPKPAEVDPELDFKDDDFTPSVSKRLRKVDALEKQVAELTKKLDAVNGHLVAQNQMTVQQKLDAFFAEKSDRYGAGSRADLEKDDPNLHRRMAVVKLAESIMAQGESPVSALKRADKIIYGDKPAEPKPAAALKPDEPTPREREWAEGGVARPTQQVPPEEPKGKRRAVRAVAEIMRDRASANGADEYRDLPE